MSTSTARALSLAIAVAVWTTISHVGKLPLQLWPVIIGLACFLAAGGGLTGFTKAVLGTASGVAWAILYITVSGALGRQSVVDAVVLGAATFGMVSQARLPLLTFTPGAIAGVAVSLGVMGTRTVTLEGGIRVVVALLIGAAIGYGAEYIAALMKTRNA
jgi:hypothetical protein